MCFRFYSLFPSHEILSSEIFCLFCFYLIPSLLPRLFSSDNKNGLYISHLKKYVSLPSRLQRAAAHFSVHVKRYLTPAFASSPLANWPLLSAPAPTLPFSTPSCSWQGPRGLQVAMDNSHLTSLSRVYSKCSQKLLTQLIALSLPLNSPLSWPL